MAGQQRRKSGQGTNAKGLRHAVPHGWKCYDRCSGARTVFEVFLQEKDHASGGTGCGGSKDSQGMPRRMAGQQRRKSGQGSNPKGLRGAVPLRRYYCGACTRSSPSSAQTKMAPAPAPAPAQTKMAPAQHLPPPATTAARPAATAPTGANQYTTEGQAKFRCGTGTVVWANRYQSLHFTGYRITATRKPARTCASRTRQARECAPPKTKSIPERLSLRVVCALAGHDAHQCWRDGGWNGAVGSVEGRSWFGVGC